MKALFLTNEYPPYVYGGAGVHVEYLTRELARMIDVDVRCYGDQNSECERLKVRGYQPRDSYGSVPKELRGVMTTLDRDLGFVGSAIDANLVHCHTWYTHMAGIWAKLNYGIPLVLTTHSLEPLRPWKREQLGNGYDFSCWVEKTAIEMADALIAVSQGTKDDILKYFSVDPNRIHIIHNGIDIDEFRKKSSRSLLDRLGVPNQPYILFVGRITRQKGIIHLVNALPYIDPKIPVVLCAGAPDTPEIGEEMKQGVDRVAATRGNVFWVREMVDRPTLIELYSNAAVFCCPSIYEPFGIINLEAMACEVPVVASAVGGIPEVVVDGDTGYLVPLRQMDRSPFEPLDPPAFSRDLAARLSELMADEKKRVAMGLKGRKRVEDVFSWTSIARQTLDMYRSLYKEK
ncbi:MAG TPA: glycogen synthase [Candidatus Ozemobacteraceae bacterium]|nr:glycogen synthase [Candidatus Ozemobacteraceae bacterium]